jgi:hypothetical protein
MLKTQYGFLIVDRGFFIHWSSNFVGPSKIHNHQLVVLL